MGARICPRCSTRVDERRAKASPFCLSCGAPLGAPSPTFGGKQPGGGSSSALPWVLGGLGAVALLVGVGVIVLVAAASDDDAPKPAPTAAATAATPPVVETAPLADAAPSAKVASTVTPPSTRFTASPGPTPTPPSRPTVTVVVPTAPTPTSTSPPLAPFNRAKAQAAIDRAGANLGSCVQSAGPFGSGSIRIDFEPDGRVGTLTRPPFAGTPEGSCISARFLSIRIGPFLGTTQSIERAFIMQQ